MSDQVTGREFVAAIETLMRSMDAGFASIRMDIGRVNDSLDRVNGRLDKQEDKIGELVPEVAEQGVKIANLNREVFDRRGRGRRAEDQPPAADAGETLSLSISPKLWAAIYAVGGAAGLKVLEWITRAMGTP